MNEGGRVADKESVGNVFLQGTTKFPWKSQIWNWSFINRDLGLHHDFSNEILFI